MALPVIDPLDLEKFPIVLNGAPLRISGDQAGTASAANPAGLRATGGNLFRDYTPWTEQEFNDWSLGFGFDKAGQSGYLWSELDATNGDYLTLQPKTDATKTNPLPASPSPTNAMWNGDSYWESKIIEATDGSLYTFMGFCVYKYTHSTDTWAIWVDVRTGIFAAADANRADNYIIDICEFQNHIIVVTRPFFRKTEPTVDATHTSDTAPLINEFYLSYTVDYGALTWTIGAKPNWFAFSMDDPVNFIFVPGVIRVIAPYNNTTVDKWATTSASPGRAKTSMLCATTCEVYGGYLFIAGSGGFGYTSGGNPDPELWVFDGQDAIDPLNSVWGGLGVTVSARMPSLLNLSTKFGGKRWVNGIAGIQGQTVGDFSVYMATSVNLYLLDLAIPTPVKVLSFDGEDYNNGKGMVAHGNDLYIPTLYGSVIRFTATGQAIKLGVDQMPVAPAVGITSATDTSRAMLMRVRRLASGPNTLLGLPFWNVETGSDTHPAVIGLSGQGWHTLQGRKPAHSNGLYACAIYYQSSTRYVHYNFANSVKAVGLSAFTAQRFLYDDDSRLTATLFAPSGDFWLGYYDADAPLLEKDWHSISLYGDCLDHEDVEIEVYFDITNELDSCTYRVDTLPYTLLGNYKDDAQNGEFIIPTTADGCASRAGKYIYVRLKVTSSNNLVSPRIRGIKLKFFVPIPDYLRFSYPVVLPHDCLNDLCEVPLTGYDQALWDQALREAACSVEPVTFRDIDGKNYLVRVESESRRTSKVKYVGPPTYREMEISWSLSFTQVMNPSMCEDGWEPSCA